MACPDNRVTRRVDQSREVTWLSPQPSLLVLRGGKLHTQLSPHEQDSAKTEELVAPPILKSGKVRIVDVMGRAFRGAPQVQQTDSFDDDDDGKVAL
jgi:hypothetical protein